MDREVFFFSNLKRTIYFSKFNLSLCSYRRIIYTGICCTNIQLFLKRIYSTRSHIIWFLVGKLFLHVVLNNDAFKTWTHEQQSHCFVLHKRLFPLHLGALYRRSKEIYSIKAYLNLCILPEMENKISSVLNFSIVVEYPRGYLTTIVYDIIGLPKTGQLIICQS